MVNLLGNNERILECMVNSCHSLNQTPLCVRESNPLYLPQVKVKWVVTRKHIYHRDPTAETESWSEPKLAGCLSQGLLGHWYREYYCFLLCLRLPLLQPAYNQRCSKPSIPAHHQFKFPFASLAVTFLWWHTGQRLRAGYLMTQAPLLVQWFGMVVKWHRTWVNPSIIAKGQGRITKSIKIRISSTTWCYLIFDKMVTAYKWWGKIWTQGFVSFRRI